MEASEGSRKLGHRDFATGSYSGHQSSDKRQFKQHISPTLCPLPTIQRCYPHLPLPVPYSMASIPTTQTVAWIEDPGPNGRLVIRHDVQVKQPGDGEVLVKMEYSGIWYSFTPAPILLRGANCNFTTQPLRLPQRRRPRHIHRDTGPRRRRHCRPARS